MVLIADDDVGTREIFGNALRTNGFTVHAVSTGSDAVAAGLAHQPHLAFVEWRLPDMSGIDVLRALREGGVATPTAMVTAVASTDRAVEAMRVGACDYLVKPVDLDEVVTLARRLAPRRSGPAEPDTVSHAASRWADAVVRLVDCPQDAPTLGAWGRWVGAAPGTIRNWCRIAGLSPKRSLDFARLLRAVYRGREDVLPQELLNVADLRTLHRLLSLGRPERTHRQALPADVGHYLRTQRWITSPRALAQIKRALEKRVGRIERES